MYKPIFCNIKATLIVFTFALQLIVVFGYFKIRILHNIRKFPDVESLKLSHENVENHRLLRVVGSPVLVVLPDKGISESKINFNNTVHLIGVSHGSPPSAKLVRDTIYDLKVTLDKAAVASNNSSGLKSPVVVALELCDDRYLSIALESKIEPRTDNETIKELYRKKLSAIENLMANDIAVSGVKGIQSNHVGRLLFSFQGFFHFVKSQGVLLGLFVGMGVLVKELQSMFHSEPRLSYSSEDISSKVDSNNILNIPFPGEDEFVTAMRVAQAFEYPVRMSDAPQAETLKNIKRVASLEIINPQSVVEGAQSLAFSALGLASEGNDLSSNTSKVSDALRKSLTNVYGRMQSEWINIPLVYAENWSMVKSLMPLFVIAGVSALLTLAADQLDAAGVGLLTSPNPLPTDITSFHMDPSTIGVSPQLIDMAWKFNAFVDKIFGLLNFEFTEDQVFAADVVIQSFSFLLLIRLAKIIGSDRDKIIASKVMKICEEFPGSDVVVVIGMLHCNGVARYLLSGVDPLAAPADSSSNLAQDNAV